MRHHIPHRILLLLALCTASLKVCAWGETTSYVLNHPDEETLNTISTGEAMALSGPGATLTFQARKQTASSQGLYVEISTNGGSSWTELSYINSSLGTSYKTFTYDISTNVTHIRFLTKFGSTLKKYYKDVKITRATTLSTSTTSLDFGTVTNRLSSTLNAAITYNNTTYDQQVTGTSTDPNFTVTPTTVGATGENQAVPVVFTPTSAGTHNATITLNMNGKSVSFQVTGVGQTTYYTRATASATEGGSAYVSFTSFDQATNTSATKNSGLTTAASATTTAYYRAVPNQRYAFVGWKRNLSDATFASTDPNFQTPAYTYNSESSGSPTVVTYYAVFEQKPNVITLEPTTSEYDLDLYETVTLHRTLLQGYNTIALPFATTVQELTSRTSDDDWVAKLSAVTYNQHDGFTLFFQKVASGRINAFEPYILHLGEQVTDPSWTDIELTAATPVTITPAAGYNASVSPSGTSYADWQMTSNFTAGFSMSGLYGIVNSAGALQRGSSTATLNAFTAYITPAPGAAGIKVRSAFTDEFGTTTYISGLPASSANSSSPLYDLSGRRITSLSQPLSNGLYIQRNRKIIVRH